MGVPDFEVEGGKDVTMSVHKADLFIRENRRNLRFKGELDEVISKVAVCSRPKRS